MGENFKGWRRKAGCVALAMALAFIFMWTRSQMVEDSLVWSGDKGEVELMFEFDSIVFAVLEQSDQLRQTSVIPQWITRESTFELEDRDHLWKFQWWGFRYGIDKGRTQSIYVWAISYSPPTVTMTLLSAYLLLSNPRRAKVPVAQPERPTTL